jgi:hypothetical protein
VKQTSTGRAKKRAQKGSGNRPTKRTNQSQLFPAGELKAWLDEAVARFNQPSFIEADPISIPHLFSKKEDIEIAAFFCRHHCLGPARNGAQKC